MFGLLWLLGIGSFIAVIAGHKAKRQIRKSNGRIGGSALATAGLVLGYLGIAGAVTVLVIATMLVPEIRSEPEAAETTTTTSQPTTSTRGRGQSRWFPPTGSEVDAWAIEAIEFVESLDLQWEDRDAAIREAHFWAIGVCQDLQAVDGLGMSTRTVDDIEADLRTEMGTQDWTNYGEVWFDSLVNELCLR